EVRSIQGQQLAPADVPVFNPAFDITPAELISAIVTEHGVTERPDAAKMAAQFTAAGNRPSCTHAPGRTPPFVMPHARSRPSASACTRTAGHRPPARTIRSA